MAPTYKELNEPNPNFDAKRIDFFNLLFTGSDTILKDSNVVKFIHREPSETQIAYWNRLKSARYDEYLSEIINKFSTSIFSKQMLVTKEDGYVDEEYALLFKNANLQGDSLPQMLRKIFIKAAVHGKGFMAIDFPENQELPTNRVDELASRASQPFISILENEQLIEWECDDFGKFTWCLLKDESNKRKNLQGNRKTRSIRFKHWFMADGAAKWETYEFQCPLNKEPKPDQEGVLISSGTTSFKEIPILEFELPTELYIGGLIGMNCADLFRRKSHLLYSEKRSLFEVAVYKQGAEIGKMNDVIPSTAQQNPRRGQDAVSDIRNRGVLVMGSDDDFEFVGPNGQAWDIYHEQIKQDTDEIHRVTHTMANSIAANDTVRSGISKMQDNKAQEIVLTAFADYLKEFALELYKVISTALEDDIQWKVLGMDSYRIVDREQTLQEVELMGMPPSRTLKKLTFERLASELEEVPPNLLDDVKNEIEEAVDAMTPEELVTNPSEQMANKQAQAALDVKSTQVKSPEVKSVKKPAVKAVKSPSKSKRK